MCPHTPEDYSPEREVRKLRTKQKQEARGRSRWTARTSAAPDEGEGRRSP
jgi:hypothetical protein